MSPDFENRPFDADQPQVRTLADELATLRLALGDRPEIRDRVLAVKRAAKVIEIVREDYQSPEFREDRHDLDPEVYGIADRSLWIVNFSDKTNIFLLAGRQTSSRPGEVGDALIAAPDRRTIGGVLYEYDGRKTITETTLATLKKNIIKGKYGHLDVLLHHMRRSAGERVNTTTFVRPKA